MAKISLYFDVEEYLKQWFVFDSGGEYPVRLRKKSPESIFIEVAIRPKREAEESPKTRGNLEIIIPSFRYKDPEYYNHFPASAIPKFIAILKKRFDLQLWNDMIRVQNMPGLTFKDELQTWMEAHGIEITDTNYEAVNKRAQRMRMRHLVAERVRRHRNTKNRH